MPTPRYYRPLDYAPEQWREFDQATINLNDAEQVGLVAGILQCNDARVYEAIKAVGPNAGAIRKWLAGQRGRLARLVLVLRLVNH